MPRISADFFMKKRVVDDARYPMWFEIENFKHASDIRLDQCSPEQPGVGYQMRNFSQRKNSHRISQRPSRSHQQSSIKNQLSKITLLLLLTTTLLAQDSLFQSPTLLPTPARDFTVDQLQNLYVTKPDNWLVKLNPAGLPVMDYTNPRLGELGQVDASNPFSIVLFYPEFQTIVTLDRNMVETGQVNLYELDILRTRAVGTASDNNLWVFDEVLGRLKKIGREGGERLVEGPLLFQLLNRRVAPVFLREHDQLVYAADPEHGILVFDVFGKYLKTLPLTGVERFHFVGPRLVHFSQERGWESFHLRTLLTRPFPLPTAVARTERLQFVVDRLYALDPAGVLVFPR